MRIHGKSPRAALVLPGAAALFVTTVALAGEGVSTVNFKVKVHIKNVGDMTFSPDVFAGSPNQDRAIERMGVFVDQSWPQCLQLSYLAHVSGVGDVGWANAGEYIGTTGQKRQLEGVAFKLSGSCAKSYAVEYYCGIHRSSLGDSFLRPDANGFCGTRGKHLKLTSFRLTIRKK